MRYIADLHIHSRFSRACSKELTLPNIAKWCRIKGIDIIGTSDFTHPQWFKEMKEQLEEGEFKGLYQLKSPSPQPSPARGEGLDINSPPLMGGVKGRVPVHFICSTELSCIYSRGGKGRRVHLVILAPSLATVEKINQKLEGMGKNLKSDGRPILGIDAEELLKIFLDIDERIMMIPAHAWTPWFAIFGSQSGFDSVEECFGDNAKYIYALETGLSSDPAMNWRLSALDKYTLVSNSDAHSLPNLGREANVFEGDEVGYGLIINALKLKRQVMGGPVIRRDDGLKLIETIEFFPEEGMYHFDGHRVCKIRLSPKETQKHKGICPVCKKPVTVGVMNRVAKLADREEGGMPKGAIPFKRLVPLDEIIAEAYGVKSSTKSVQAEYDNLIKKCGSEFEILLDRSFDELAKVAIPGVVEGIRRVREGKLHILPGYDGEYGTVKIFSDEEKKKLKGTQKTLF